MFIVIETFWEEESDVMGGTITRSGHTRINPHHVTNYFEGETKGTTFLTLACGSEIVAGVSVDEMDAIMNTASRVFLLDDIKES